MFGAVCSGRPIQLATQVEQTKYVIAVPDAGHVSHIALFILPQPQFTDASYTGLVYIQMPGAGEFKLMGGLNPNKPSAIYKMNAAVGHGQPGMMDDVDMLAPGTGNGAVINIGISIEPTAQAEQLLAEEKQKTSGSSTSLVRATRPVSVAPAPQDVAVLANRIVTHAYNYLGGFIDSAGKVPMKAFDTWWDKFKAKLQNNPSFLDEL